MTKYQEFLKKIGIISEEEFNKVASSFPTIDIELLNTYDYDLDELRFYNKIATMFIEVILQEYAYVYVEDIDFDSKEISLGDIQSLEDLNNIQKELSNWTISNYEELKEDLLEAEQEDKNDKEYCSKINLINKVINNVPIEDLKEFVEKYVDKR